MLKLRRRTMWLLITLILFVLASTAVQARTVKFTVHSPPERMPLYEAFFDAFTNKTGIEVEFIQAPGGQPAKWEQVIVQMAGGVSPDVVGAVSVEFVQYAAAGLIQPVDTYLARDADALDQVIPTLLDALQWQGQQYMMPYGASGLVMAYNENLVDQAGLARPPADCDEPAWEYNDYVQALRQLTRLDPEGNVTQFGLAGPFIDGWFTIPYQWGGDWISDDLTQFAGNQQGAINALEALQDLRWVQHVMPQPGEAGGGIEGFVSGTSATGGFGTWNLQAIAQANAPLQLMPWFQVNDNPQVGTINPVGLALLASAPNSDEAWEFIKFATLDPEGNYLYAQAAGALPGVFGEPHHLWLTEWEDIAPNLNPMVFVQQVAEHPAIVNIRRVTTFDEINPVMTDAVNAVLNNTMSAQSAMDEVADIVQLLIDMSEH